MVCLLLVCYRFVIDLAVWALFFCNLVCNLFHQKDLRVLLPCPGAGAHVLQGLLGLPL